MEGFNFDGIIARKEEIGVVFYPIDKKGNILNNGRGLFALTWEGKLFLYKDVDPELGFKLDKGGHIVVEGVTD